MTRALAAAASGLAVALAATAFAVTALYVPGIGIALTGLGAAAWVALAGRHVRLTREASGATVEEGAPYVFEIRIERARLAGELSDPLLERPLCGVRSGRLRVETAFPRRGRRRLGPATLTFRDPLRLAERQVRSAEHEVLVLPRVEPVASDVAGGLEGTGLESSAGRTHDAALEFDSLRPYRLGTPASRIHWPTVARQGTMVERRLVADVDARPLVVVDARDAASEEALDRALRAAASLTVHLARAGGCAVLLPGDRHPASIDSDLRGWPSVHARLALVERGAAAAPPRAGGAILWVTAGAAAAAAADYVISPQPLARLPVAFKVAGCTGHRIAGRRRRAA